jgi:raffinose/stachyose/melibiose transport system permease protein
MTIGRQRSGSGPERAHPLAFPALLVLACFAFVPLLVLVSNALKTKSELGTNPLGPPIHPVLANIPHAWSSGGFATTMTNSTILAVSSAIGVSVIATTAAYALTRLRLPGGKGMMMYVFICTAIPAQLFVVPLFFLWTRLRLSDSLIGLVLIYWAVFSPFATLLMRSFLLTLPRELEDAARVDGATELQVLTRIVVPLARPGVLVVALITALFAWNEFYFATTFIQDEGLKPIATSFLAFRSKYSTDWGLISAAGLIMILPPALLFLALQKRFIAGLTAGGLKG